MLKNQMLNLNVHEKVPNENYRIIRMQNKLYIYFFNIYTILIHATDLS